MILDAETLEPAAAVDVLVRGTAGLGLPGRRQDGDARLRRRAEHAASARGRRRRWRRLPRSARERRRSRGRTGSCSRPRVRIRRRRSSRCRSSRRSATSGCSRHVGRAARRQGVNGLHVHVGVETRGALPRAARGGAAVAAGGARALGELAARRRRRDGDALGRVPRSSPSCRARARRRPSARTLAGRRGSSGSSGWACVDDDDALWWDVRPHPGFGTLEIRIADQPTGLARTELLVRLVHGLVERAPAREADPAARGDYAQNRWAAARYGLDALLVHPDGDRAVEARGLARELLGAEPPEPEAVRQLEIAGARRASPPSPRTSSRGR